MKYSEDFFKILKEIQNNPDFSQRKLSKELGISLGKLNYCLRELKKKGFIKFKNFKNRRNKIQYLKYIITPKGISERLKLTINFMKKKFKEYDELKKDLKYLKNVDSN